MAGVPDPPRGYVLTFGDNGSQVYFSGTHFVILNPYTEIGGTRYGAGWVLFCLPAFLLVDNPANPGEHFGHLSLKALLEQIRESLDVQFELVGAPDGLPDQYPLFDWDAPPPFEAETTPLSQGEPQQLSLL